MKHIRYFIMATMIFPITVHAAQINILEEGKFFGEIRYRYETVHPDNALRDANAHTVRTNLGYQTGKFKGLSVLLEGQFVRHIGQERFNSFDNNKGNYSVVADPDTVELNRLQLNYDDIPDTSIILGRQFLNLNNQRFIGTVDFRQNDQTFDALTLINKSLKDIELQYSFINQVNRIFDGKIPPARLDSKTHLLNLSYQSSEFLKTTAYSYLMSFDNARPLSNQTSGLRVEGAIPLFAVKDIAKLTYEAEFATQSDYDNNPNHYNENYYHLSPKISVGNMGFGLGYEVLTGDGTHSFQTPLATLHKFNGWADMFLNTPANGLEDSYVTASYKMDFLYDINATGVYHSFKGNKAGDYGCEFDFSFEKSFPVPLVNKYAGQVNMMLKYSDYQADDTPYVDTQRIWLQAGLKF